MNKTIRYTLATLMALGLAAIPAQADDLEVSGDMSIASQYVWRGVTQTTGKTALQGDLGVSLSGLSASVWFSNAYQSPAPQFNNRDVVEFDWTLDYSNSFGDSGLDYSVGAIGYTYLYDSASNFPEIYAGLSYGPVSVTAYYNIKDSFNNAYLRGDTWVDIGLSGSIQNFDISGSISYANWKKNKIKRTTPDQFKNGFNLVTLGVSKDIELANVTMTPSFTATIPVISKGAAGNRSIYGTTAKNEVVAALNFAY
ncbi:MAG: TorF family putative porin [Mariprofundaceae bacterium]|nr:TorF family putative porin [Mariprofundaceae bacterium]